MSSETSIPAEAFDPDRSINGAKMALFLGEDLAVMMRDDFPHIDFPAHFDFPGGAREPGESAVDCVLRETFEELSLSLTPEVLSYGRVYLKQSGLESWFFAAHLSADLIDQVRLGDEGQFWQMMSVEEFLAHPKAIPSLRMRLSDYLAVTGGR